MSFLCSFCAARVESFCHQRHRGSNKMEVNGLFNNVFVWFLIYLSNKRTLFTTQNSSIGGSYLIIRNFHFQLNYAIESKQNEPNIFALRSHFQMRLRNNEFYEVLYTSIYLYVTLRIYKSSFDVVERSSFKLV